MLILLAALLAAVPEKGEGTITLFGGLRTILPSNNAYVDEQGATHQPIQYGGMSSFGYQWDDELHFKIEIGWLVDHYKIPNDSLDVHSVPILLALDTALIKTKAWTL